MTQILYGAPVAEQLFEKTKQAIEENHIKGCLAIFMLGENHPGVAYVRRKIAYAEKLGLQTEIYSDMENIYADIENCNKDASCLGIIVQLPLPTELQAEKKQILDAVDPIKDVDCLGEKLLAMSNVGTREIDITPATPAAVLHMLEYYNLDKDIAGATISVLGEGDLVGKALATLLQHMGATVHTFNEFSDQDQMRSICKSSSMIIAATGKIHLVDESFVADDQSQIVIDVGRGMLNGKPAGDVHGEALMGKVAALTPVPGGVGPVTVASLFWNIVSLWKARQ